MVSAAYYRERADALRKRAKAASDRDEALALNLRAVEFDYLAEQAEGGQVQQQVEQRGTEAPPPSSQGHQDQPAQQQQQVQPKDPDTSES